MRRMGKVKVRGNGQGSVYQVPGRRKPWCALVTVGRTEEGELVRASRYLSSEPEAWAMLEEMQERVYAGVHPNEGRERPEIAVTRKARVRRIRSLTRRGRFLILQRDGFACRYCGRKPPEIELQVDHIVPVARGGNDDKDNLVASCKDCNTGKRDLLLAVPLAG